MTNDYPYLSLNQVTIDAALVRRLPRTLAYYHLALPLAEDGDQISVVMAHPENEAVVTTLEMLLRTRIVPVLGAASQIKAALDGVWQHETESSVVRIVSWGASPERSVLANAAADLFAKPLAAQATHLDGEQCDLETVVTVAREGQYGLTVISMPTGELLTRFLRRAPTPVLLIQDQVPALEHILVALRGHSPDSSALNWVIPLARQQGCSVTLLAISGPAEHSPIREIRTRHSLATLLNPDSAPAEHILACTRRLTEVGIQGKLRLCQGVPEQQIAQQFIQGKADLLIIAAEAQGDFIQRVLNCIHNLAAENVKAVLIVKPIAEQIV